jgi:CubicO group peptidase (beta-lactamase class C family)
MRWLAILLVTVVYPIVATAQTGIAVPEMAACESLINDFVANKGLPGLSFALAREGRIVYSRGFGKADLARTENTQPYHLFRIGSISKSITSVAVYRLIEAGSLNLSDKVFGVGGLLEHHPEFAAANIVDERIYDITVQMLLEHTAGWQASVDCTPNPTSPYPWHADSCSPELFPLYVTQTLGRANPATPEAFITFLLEYGLDFNPGMWWAYSNTGYLVLGEIIEMLSGMSYEEYVQEEVLHSHGIYDLHLGESLREDKRVREVEYKGMSLPGFDDTVLSSFGDGTLVPWEYGGLNLGAAFAAGAWIATPQDLLKLLTAVDGFATKPDILSAPSHASMTEPSTSNRRYAKGWQVNRRHDQGHTGGLWGTAALWKSTRDGYTWAIVVNTNPTGPKFWPSLDRLGPDCINATSTWPTHDLMASPTVAASDVAVWEEGGRLEVVWSNGDGERRIVTVSAESSPDAFPLDGTNYEADSLFGAGSDLGGENYVVFDGTDDRVIVSGLMPGEKYRFRVFEYNQNADTGDHALYLLGNHPDAFAVPKLTIDLDIKPGSDPNAVNPTARGILPVAVLGSDTFDVADVDATTMAFGPGEATPVHRSGGHPEDVNDDGYTDWISHYRIEEVAVAAGDTEFCLTGETLDGIPFEGCDAIMTVPYVGERRRIRVNRQR